VILLASSAARVSRGAGVRLTNDPSVGQIQAAITQVLAEPRFRENAKRLASAMANEKGDEAAATELKLMVRR